jgi:hypothetical protein
MAIGTLSLRVLASVDVPFLVLDGSGGARLGFCAETKGFSSADTISRLRVGRRAGLGGA